MLAYYDLAVSPPTYDIVAFLCAVERIRQERGEDRVEIAIIPGPDHGFRRDRLWPFTIAGRQEMLDRVALPMARMLPGATVSVGNRPAHAPAGSVGLGRKLYGLREQLHSMERVGRPLRPAFEVSKSDRLVTITLREAQHWPERNSNVVEWVAAARAIEARGFEVVVIRDTLRAEEQLPGVHIDPRASIDLDHRARLYRSAACNMFVSSGPAWFALALDAPVLMLRPASPSSPTSTERHMRACGILPDGQLPGAPHHQRLVWASDDRVSILAAFADWELSI